MNIGNHCVLFGPKIVSDTEEIIKALRDGGADGVEIGKRFLGEFRSDELKTLLSSNGMELSAYHIVEMLPSVFDDPSSLHDDIEKAAEFLKDYPVKNILMSAMVMPMAKIDSIYDRNNWDERFFNEEKLLKLCETLEREALYLKKMGIQLHLHNHDWEFLFDGILMNAYLEYVPDMNIALDIGWAYAAGADPVALFEKYPERFSYIHARDLHISDIPKCTSWHDRHERLFCDLGDGEIPLKEVFSTLEKITNGNGWITVEYENGDQSFSRYQNATRLVRKLLK